MRRRKISNDEFGLDEEYVDSLTEELIRHIKLGRDYIKKAHRFEHKIHAFEQIIIYLTQSELVDYDKLRDYLVDINEEFQKLQELITKDDEFELHIVQESRKLSNEIKKRLKHHIWRAIWKKRSRKQKKEIDADIIFLKKIVRHFKKLIGLIDNEEHIIIKGKNVAYLKHNGKVVKFESELDFYFHYMYRFVKVYEEVFEHMVKKEEHLLKKDGKKKKEWKPGWEYEVK